MHVCRFRNGHFGAQCDCGHTEQYYYEVNVKFDAESEFKDVKKKYSLYTKLCMFFVSGTGTLARNATRRCCGHTEQYYYEFNVKFDAESKFENDA